MNFLIMQFSPSFFCFLCLRSTCSLQHSVLWYPQSVHFPHYKQSGFICIQKSKQNYIFVCFNFCAFRQQAERQKILNQTVTIMPQEMEPYERLFIILVLDFTFLQFLLALNKLYPSHLPWFLLAVVLVRGSSSFL